MNGFGEFLTILVIFGLPISGWIIKGVLSHQERMEMLRRGIVPPPDMKSWKKWSAQQQRYGAQPPWSGAQQQPPPWSVNAQQPPPPWSSTPVPPPSYTFDYESAQQSLRKGITTSLVGLALLIGLSFIGYHGGDGPLSPPEIHPGPWLLGGLIPMFVGVAQIIIAVVSGAQIGIAPRFSGGGMPPPQQPHQQQPSAGTYRPEPPPARPHPTTTYEELARPVPPPDIR